MKTIAFIVIMLFFGNNLSFGQTNADQSKDWTTFEENGKYGFRYSDYKRSGDPNVVALAPIFEYRIPYFFLKNSKYNEVVKSFDRKIECPCRTEAYEKFGITSFAIINRKGEEVISPANNHTGYHVLQPTIFALEIAYHKPPDIKGCSITIINIETKEVIAKLAPNKNGNQAIIQPKYLMRMRDFDFENSFYVNTSINKAFSEKLYALHSKEKFDYILIYPEDFNDSNTPEKVKGFSAYLLWNDGKHKLIKEEWFREL